MKRLLIITFLLSITLLGIISCQEDIVSSKHVYTEAELAYRDSVEAAKWAIKADYIFTYDVTIPMDTVNYTGVQVEVDENILLEKLGYASAEELTTALGTVDGGAQFDNEVIYFAINGSTNYDYTSGFTANGLGFWFDKNGDVCSWGDVDAVFSEFDSEAFTFFVGQHPGHITTGETFKVVQAMSKADYRVAFVINITVGEYYQEVIPEAQVVATNDLELSVTPDNSYAAAELAFDFDAAASAIGVSTDELTSNEVIYGINPDDSKTSAYTADAGYWYNKDGNVCSWGTDGCALYVNYSDGIFYVGQYPDACVSGDVYHVSLGIMYNNEKMVVYNITVNITGYQDPETAPTGDPVALEKSYDASQAYAADWSANSRIDVKEDLREAFKMTTYQIAQAIESNELVLKGVNADGTIYTDGDGNAVSTANYPGHWFAASGNVTAWGSETDPPIVYCELSHTNESLELSIGHHPDNAKSGDTVTIKQIAELNGGSVTFTVTIKIEQKVIS